MALLVCVLLATAAACAHAADVHSLQPVSPVVLGVGLAVVVLIGLGFAVAHTPAAKRNPVDMWQCQTKVGVQPWHRVVLPNLMPALAVTLVSIPLSLALGITTGTPPMMGIATAVLGGIVSGTFGSSAFTVVGPTGSLVGILMRFTSVYGPEVLPWVALTSGSLIMLASLLRLHDYCMFMPKAVFEGFTVSVGLCIGFGQFDFAFGLSPGPPLKVPGLELSPAIFKLAASLKAFATLQISIPGTVLFLVGVAVMLVLYRHKPSVPWMVPFAVTACLLGALCDKDAIGVIPVQLPTLKSKYGIMSCWIATGLKPLTQVVSEAAERGKGSYGDIFSGAISVAMVSVLETLISGKIAQTRSQMPYDTAQELQGLALSHAACGICGLMPPAGVFVRTAVNLSSGATHRASQFFQGIIVLLFAAILMPALSYLPQGAVAAILVTASIRMMPTAYISQVWQKQKWYFVLLWAVALVCWCLDSVSGIGGGTAVALLVTGKETAKGHAEVSVTAKNGEELPDGTPKMIAIDALSVDDKDLAKKDTAPKLTRSKSMAERQMETELFLEAMKQVEKVGYSHLAEAPHGGFDRQCSVGSVGSLTRGLFRDEEETHLRAAGRGHRVFLYKFLGQLDFLNGDRHADRLRTILASEPQGVVISMDNVPWIDPDGMDALQSMITMLEDHGARVHLACTRPKVAQSLEKEAWYQEKIAQQKRVHPTEKAALLAALGKKDVAEGAQGA